jgi:hypothetical protein
MKYTNLFAGLLISTGAILLSCKKEKADTPALIRAKAVGKYHCSKIIVSYWNSPVDLRQKRLPETTLNVVAVGPDLIKVRHQTLYFSGVFTEQWPFSSEVSYYYFTDYNRDEIRYFGEFRLEAKGDSLIYRNKIQFPSRAPDTIWYCRRLP